MFAGKCSGVLTSKCCYCRSEDEEFKEAVDLYNSGRLEESICLAKESLKRSTENLLVEGYDRLEDAEDDTEVEGMS